MLKKITELIKRDPNIRDYSGNSWGSTDYELGLRNAPQIDSIEGIDIGSERIIYNYRCYRASSGKGSITVFGSKIKRNLFLNFMKGNQVRIVPKIKQKDLVSKLSEKLKVETSDISFWGIKKKFPLR